MMVPKVENNAILVISNRFFLYFLPLSKSSSLSQTMHAPQYTPKQTRRTGPTKSGTNSTNSPTLAKMKKKPIKVTILGASHTGNKRAAQFHCYHPISQRFC